MSAVDINVVLDFVAHDDRTTRALRISMDCLTMVLHAIFKATLLSNLNLVRSVARMIVYLEPKVTSCKEYVEDLIITNLSIQSNLGLNNNN